MESDTKRTNNFYSPPSKNMKTKTSNNNTIFTGNESISINSPNIVVTKKSSNNINNLFNYNNNDTTIPLYVLPVHKIGDMFLNLAKICSKLLLSLPSAEMYIKAINFYEKLAQDKTLSLRICEIYNNAGIEYDKSKLTELSLNSFEKVLELRIKHLGEDNIQTAGAYNNIAITYDKLGDYNKAIEMAKKSMKIRLKYLSQDDIKIGHTYYNLGLSLNKAGNYDESIEYLNKALNIFVKLLGKENILCADCSLSIGEAYKCLENYKEAVKVLEYSYNVYNKLCGKEHLTTMKAALLVGMCYGLYNKSREGYQYLKIGLENKNVEKMEGEPLIIEARKVFNSLEL